MRSAEHLFHNTPKPIIFFGKIESVLFQIHRHSKCRIAALLSLSVILSSSSMASATSEKQGRVLLDNTDSAVNSIGKAAAFKTDDLIGQEVTGDGKSIGVDYTLYNYGRSPIIPMHTGPMPVPGDYCDQLNLNSIVVFESRISFRFQPKHNSTLGIFSSSRAQ